MMSCREAMACLHLYIDGEAGAREQLSFEAHLLECSACRAEYESVRAVVDTVRGSTPLYPADRTLRARISSMLERNGARLRNRNRIRAALMAAAFAATLLVFASLPVMRSQHFSSFAASTHVSYAQGSLPLAVISGQPAVVSGWLQTHLPFHFALPDFQPGGANNYSLVGARVLKFAGEEIAYLAYTMDARPISLLVSTSAPVLPSGGQTFRSGKLDFHFSSDQGLKLITWTDRGLSYALVSDIQVEGAESCAVCHGSQRERQKFEKLLRLP